MDFSLLLQLPIISFQYQIEEMSQRQIDETVGLWHNIKDKTRTISTQGDYWPILEGIKTVLM